MLACARAAISPDVARARDLAQLFVDWPRLIDASANQKLTGLVYRCLSGDCPDLVPPAVLQRLRAEHARRAAHQIVMCSELRRVREVLAAAGISALQFKGPVLAHTAYPQPADRHYRDLDILVQPADSSRATQILLAAGYNFQQDSRTSGLNGTMEVALKHVHLDCAIDLHWNLLAYYLPRVNHSLVWSRARSVEIDGAAYQTLCPEHHFVYTCMDGLAGCWVELIGTCDVAMMLRNVSLNWDEVVRTAEAWRASRPLAIAVMLAHELLAAPVPQPILAQARRNKAACEQAQRAQAALQSDPPDTAGRRLGVSLHLKGMSDLRSRSRYLIHRGLRPTHSDHDLISLPALLRFAYFLLRPARMLWRWLVA